jgi:hypothetical protein
MILNQAYIYIFLFSSIPLLVTHATPLPKRYPPVAFRQAIEAMAGLFVTEADEAFPKSKLYLLSLILTTPLPRSDKY